MAQGETVDQLRASLRGSLLQPQHPDYDQARRLFNGMIVKSPAAIVRAAGAADVVRAVSYAAEHNLPVAVRGGGHNVAGYASCDDGVLIDFTRMRGIRVDPKRRTARVGPGATYADFDPETVAFGLATTGGTVASTGLAGLTLGAG